jgi:hypothetical protein
VSFVRKKRVVEVLLHTSLTFGFKSANNGSDDSSLHAVGFDLTKRQGKL